MDIRTSAFPYEHDAQDNAKIVGVINIPAKLTVGDIIDVTDTALAAYHSWLQWVKIGRDVEETTCMSEKVGRGGMLILNVDSYLEEHTGDTIEVTLTAEKMVQGCQLYALNHFWQFELGDVDADIADCILQYALFGKIIFC